MSVSPPSQPLLAIVGATGTGKSQLAVDLAVRFNGEIINTDALQLYDGLPIITNKIKKIRSRGRLPILVGGTHYYTQSLLFRDTLVQTPESSGEGDEGRPQPTLFDAEKKWPILQGSAEEMLVKLREVDPIIAARWHPNDVRKIRRSLEIWLQTGKRASEVYAEQEVRRKAGDDLIHEGDEAAERLLGRETPGLRFQTLILWVHVPREKAADRLNRRVDQMMESGLLKEALDLDAFANSQTALGLQVDLSRGIYAAVGYKEFRGLLDAVKTGVSDPAELKRLEEEGIEMTKAATRRYAKTQLRWIRIKLFNALQEVGAQRNLAIFDALDPTTWTQTVLNPAISLAETFLSGVPLPERESTMEKELLEPPRHYDLGRRRELWKQTTCVDCNVTAVTEEDWQNHVKGHRHRQVLRKVQRREKALQNRPLHAPDRAVEVE